MPTDSQWLAFVVASLLCEWLPGESEPVVAGAVDRVAAGRLDFTYARSYLDYANAISLYRPELPLRRGAQEPLDGRSVAACLEEATRVRTMNRRVWRAEDGERTRDG